MLVQWLDRGGLGQWLAPDPYHHQQQQNHKHKQQVAEEWDLWQVLAPDDSSSVSKTPTTPTSSSSSSEDDDDHRDDAAAKSSKQQQQQTKNIVTKNKNNNSKDHNGYTASSRSVYANAATRPRETPTAIATATTATDKSLVVEDDINNNNNCNNDPTASKTTTTSTTTLSSSVFCDTPDPTSSDFVLSSLHRRILQASFDTHTMPQRNKKFVDHANKAFGLCMQAKKASPQHLQTLTKLLHKDHTRFQMMLPHCCLRLHARSRGVACPDGYTLLMAAAANNQKALAEVLLQELPEEQLLRTNLYGQTPALVASYYGHVDMVEYLQQREQQLLQQPELLQDEEEPDIDNDDQAAPLPITLSSSSFVSPTASSTTATPRTRQCHTTPGRRYPQSASSVSSSSGLRPSARLSSRRNRRHRPPSNDIAGQTAWATAMMSPKPSAKKNRALLHQKLYSHDNPNLLGTTNSNSISRSIVRHPRLPNVWYEAAHLNGQRVWNEDAYVAQTLVLETNSQTQPPLEALLLMVCDGHGDQGFVSKFITQHLPAALQTHFRKEMENEQDDSIHAATTKTTTATVSPRLRDFWTRVCQQAAWQVEQDLQQATLAGGSTALWALLTPHYTVVANVGDCRCLLLQQPESTASREPTIVPLSEDHKPDLPNEQARIEAAGLTIVHEPVPSTTALLQQQQQPVTIPKVQLSESDRIGVSRTLGDFEYKKNVDLPMDEQALICLPDVQVVPRQLGVDTHLILACDGVWDVQTNHQVARFVTEDYSGGNLTPQEYLQLSCLSSGDNLTLLIVSLDQPPPRQAVQVQQQQEEEESNQNSTTVTTTTMTSPRKKLLFQSP